MARKQPKLGYAWHLRRLMAEHGMFATTVAQVPERLNLNVLVALCDILGCAPSDLIEPVAHVQRQRRAAGVADPKPAPRTIKPTKARVARDDKRRS